MAEMKESEFIQRAKKDDSKNNPGFEQSHNGVDSILPPTQHLQIRVSSKTVNLTLYNKTEKYVRAKLSKYEENYCHLRKVHIF